MSKQISVDWLHDVSFGGTRRNETVWLTEILQRWYYKTYAQF